MYLEKLKVLGRGGHADTLIFGGKIIACPGVDWQATGGEKMFTNYNAFSCPCLFCFIVSFAQIE